MNSSIFSQYKAPTHYINIFLIFLNILQYVSSYGVGIFYWPIFNYIANYIKDKKKVKC